MRSDNPVFVFSSLLTQHQFGPENFNIGPLKVVSPLEAGLVDGAHVEVRP